jgi:hypothetical protein
MVVPAGTRTDWAWADIDTKKHNTEAAAAAIVDVRVVPTGRFEEVLSMNPPHAMNAFPYSTGCVRTWFGVARLASAHPFPTCAWE